MIHEKWCISDTHFYHSNILKFVDDAGKRIRPFECIKDMHQKILDNWNEVVGPNDFVYHLGDVTFKYDYHFKELMFHLNGRKRLLLGNHDRINSQSPLFDVFEKIDLWRGFKEYGFTMTHIPIPLENLRDGKFNVHGHLHQNLKSDPHYINVCVEHWDYTPVHFDQIQQIIKERS